MDEILIQNDMDGRGQYIAQWPSDLPRPTDAEIAAAWTAYQNWVAQQESAKAAKQQLRETLKTKVAALQSANFANNNTRDQAIRDLAQALNEFIAT